MLKVVVGADPGELKELFSLAEAKKHLRVDHTDDDTLIEGYASAAVGAALAYVKRDLVPDDEGAVAAFRSAALLMLGDLYEYRETGQVGSVSSAINVMASARFLLDPWRILTV